MYGELKGIELGGKMAKYPILQGGMGVGVSLHKLAGAVSKAGGIGCISTADIGFKKENFYKNPLQANIEAIGEEIKMAREIAGEDKILAVNIMHALKDYEAIVNECVKQEIDLIISGAGIPLNLPQYTKGSKTKIAPIVSSKRCLELIVKTWKRKYDYTPDMVVIEGPKAGGHLGFKKEELKGDYDEWFGGIVKEIIAYVRNLEIETGQKIPVIVAGGIFDGADMRRYLEMGADGVQLATRFVATDECDAAEEYKEAYINAKKEDIKIIQSPVGMPGRAINNAFVQRVTEAKDKITRCYGCIKTCNVKDAPYCITKALINAVEGRVDEGLIFVGENVDRIKEIISVDELMKKLLNEFYEVSLFLT
ncbi:MAG: nitronate monooxygenase [Lachnospiraceae bacterium]|nr:nitronate monooxygenase [Lachnospiraceae bacterium]